jgi:tape measure domain-containing protein
LRAGRCAEGCADHRADTAVGGFLALGAAIGAGVADAREANQLLAATEQVIRSTGGVAGVTAQQVTDLATALSAASGKSLFGDAEIQASENMLLTFTNIGSKCSPRPPRPPSIWRQAFHKTP